MPDTIDEFSIRVERALGGDSKQVTLVVIINKKVKLGRSFILSDDYNDLDFLEQLDHWNRHAMEEFKKWIKENLFERMKQEPSERRG